MENNIRIPLIGEQAPEFRSHYYQGEDRLSARFQREVGRVFRILQILRLYAQRSL